VRLFDGFLAKDHFLGGLPPFLGGFWHSRQFGIVVVSFFNKVEKFFHTHMGLHH
jgi:hypothetical protein